MDIAPVNEYFFAVLDLKEVEAVQIQWRSPLWQQVSCPGMAPSGRAPGIRAFQVGNPDTIIKVAARSAFWSIGVATLVALAKHVGVNLSTTTDLFPVLWDLVQGVLAISDQETLEI